MRMSAIEHQFYLCIECGHCGRDILSGPHATLMQTGELPVIPYDIADNARFHCDECGADTSTGFFGDLTTVEGGDVVNDATPMTAEATMQNSEPLALSASRVEEET